MPGSGKTADDEDVPILEGQNRGTVVKNAPDVPPAPLAPSAEVAIRLRTLAANLEDVRQRIDAACRRCGRAVADVTLVAVTKYVDAATAGLLLELGVHDLGESRPQELWRKAEALPRSVRWHMIGHWQSNKVRRTLPFVALAHSLDRKEIAEAVSTEAVRLGRIVDACLEIKLTDEPTKHGFEPNAATETLAYARTLPGLRIVGLMGMAPLDGGTDAAAAAYRRLRSLRDDLRGGADDLPVLSMGMSDDFEVAVELGATHVRVGSALWKGFAE